MLFRKSLFLGLFVLSAAMFTQGASAAPQILGLMATNVPQTLVCRDGECTAELASYCLQPGRAEPWGGHPYEVVDGADMSLIGRRPDGRLVRVPAKSHATFAANVAMTTVRISVDSALLRDLGVNELALDVGAHVSLLPKSIAGDPHPLTAAEIAQATGPDRMVGAEFFEEGGPVGSAARITAAMLTVLPKTGKITSDERRGLWDAAISPALEAVSDPEGIGKARRMYEACVDAMDTGIYFSMRDCIERHHSGMVRKQNRELRKNLKTGW